MLAELEEDLTHDTCYFAKRFNDDGRSRYVLVLREALESGGPETIRDAFEPVSSKYWILETRTTTGKRSTTPRTAARTLAEGEFNRYYMLAICRRASSEGNGSVLVVRSKPVDNPRADPLVKVNEGDILDATQVLDDLREHPGTDSRLGIPRGPNSGLSLRFSTAP